MKNFLIVGLIFFASNTSFCQEKIIDEGQEYILVLSEIGQKKISTENFFHYEIYLDEHNKIGLLYKSNGLYLFDEFEKISTDSTLTISLVNSKVLNDVKEVEIIDKFLSKSFSQKDYKCSLRSTNNTEKKYSNKKYWRYSVQYLDSYELKRKKLKLSNTGCISFFNNLFERRRFRAMIKLIDNNGS